MRKFNVVVNGTSYQVEVEELGGATVAAPIAQVAAPVVAQTVAAPVAAPVAPKVSKVAGGTPLKSPMPGNIFKIVAPDGSKVKKGDVIVVLEAMKMENDIVAPMDGTVSILVAKGAVVNSGDMLATIA